MFARSLLRLRAPAVAAASASVVYYTTIGSQLESAPPKAGLDPSAWKKLTLTKVEPITANTAMYRFSYDDPKATSGMTVASCLLTKANIGSEKPDGSRAAVIRPYTPTTRPEVAGYLDLVVKAYPEGKSMPCRSGSNPQPEAVTASPVAHAVCHAPSRGQCRSTLRT